MGYKQISGVEFECDNCGTVVMTAGDADVGGGIVMPKGWFGGAAFESSGERGNTRNAVDWVACKASCIGNAVRKMIDKDKPDTKGSPDD